MKTTDILKARHKAFMRELEVKHRERMDMLNNPHYEDNYDALQPERKQEKADEAQDVMYDRLAEESKDHSQV